MKTDYKKELNPKQYEAVINPPGPLLVFAGAGSGKTRVLTYRIAYMIDYFGIDPREILAVTFTNKAAGEMRERMRQILGMAYLPVMLLTFHSFGARILRETYGVIGYRKNFSIYDESESLMVLKRIIAEENMERGDLTPKAAKYLIGRAKDDMLDPDAVEAKATSPRMRDLALIYRKYQQRLLELNAFDFDDLIYFPVIVFDSHPNILNRYRSRFPHLLIDEYQDTSNSQYRLVQHLAGEHKSITAVGDDDQSIYGWRGANIKNILKFEKDFPGTKVIKLERNYRSTQNILSAASGLIANNDNRKKKALWTDIGSGGKVKVMECSDEQSEALTIIDRIVQHRKGEGLRFSDFVILYRTNAQSRALEEGLRTSGIPYVIIGGVRFYERKEIRDILAYLRVLVNPDDDVSTRRIINTPKRGIGDTTVERLFAFAQKNRINMLTGCFLAAEGKIPGIATSKIIPFTEIIKKLSAIRENGEPLSSFVDKVIDISGYRASLSSTSDPEDEARLENIEELVVGVTTFEYRNPGATLEDFLEEVSLLTDVDRWDPNADAITLMTLHSAKGLEFPVVFIAGLEDGLLPLIRSGEGEDLGQLEEERRLMYVGMTRAKKHLYLTYSRYRKRYNSPTFSIPSRFLKEIPKDTLDFYTDTTKYYSESDKARRSGKYGLEDIRQGSFPIGAEVYHNRFGYGIVLSTEGSGDNEMVTVSFNRIGRKKLMIKFANLLPADK